MQPCVLSRQKIRRFIRLKVKLPEVVCYLPLMVEARRGTTRPCGRFIGGVELQIDDAVGTRLGYAGQMLVLANVGWPQTARGFNFRVKGAFQERILAASASARTAFIRCSKPGQQHRKQERIGFFCQEGDRSSSNRDQMLVVFRLNRSGGGGPFAIGQSVRIGHVPGYLGQAEMARLLWKASIRL